MARLERMFATGVIRGDTAFVISSDLPARQLIRVPTTDSAVAEDRVPRYAWVVVAVVAVTLTMASGARFLFGVVLKPMSDRETSTHVPART